MGRLESLFRKNNGNLIYKWSHYFDIYERFFERYVDQEVTILEIGVYRGGSLKMWKEYFGSKAQIYGVDINPECKKFEEERIQIIIGSQEDRSFLNKLKASIPKVDIIIDDGGHTMHQQIVTFEEMFDHIKDNGIYLCEDTHTSYWHTYGGGFRNPDSFIEYSKDLVDSLTGWHYGKVNKYTKSIKSINFFDSIVVFEKASINEPEAFEIGMNQNVKKSAINNDKLNHQFYLKTVLKRIRKAFILK
jgi:hypothetical protein